MNAIAAVLLVCSAVSNTPSDVARELASANIRRVGVVPRVMQKVDGREVIAERLGPNSELISQKFSAALAEIASKQYQGRLSVVSHRVMRGAFDKLSPESLGDVSALQKIGKETGVTALIAVYVRDAGNTLEESYGIVPISGDESGEVKATKTTTKTIAEFAYMGGSFEARRWVNKELVPVGLKPDAGPADPVSSDLPLSTLNPDQRNPLLQKDAPYGIEIVLRSRAATRSDQISFLKGVVPIIQANCLSCHNPAKASGGYDMTSFAKLLGGGESGLKAITPGDAGKSYLLEKITPRNSQAEMPKGKRPLAANEIAVIRKWIEAGAVDDSSVGAAIKYDPAQPTVFVGNDLYVPMNANEVYGIRVWNKSQRPVYMALYIDGVNTIGKQMESPNDTPITRVWYLKPNPQPSVITGYLTIQNVREQSSELFVTAESMNSLAAQTGFTDQLGMITAIFFDYVPRNGENQKALPQIGTRAGERQRVTVTEWGPGIKGSLLSSMTLRYATQADIDTYKQNGPSQAAEPVVTTERNRPPVTAPDDGGEPKQRPMPTESSTDSVAAIASADPDESVPFPREGVATTNEVPKKE